MEMKNKQNKNFIILIVAGVILVLGLITFFIIRSLGESNKLSLNEKLWIENNKNKVIDISVMNNVPVFAMEGDGIFFSFLDYFEESTGLE
jgi:hypothetical protein